MKSFFLYPLIACTLWFAGSIAAQNYSSPTEYFNPPTPTPRHSPTPAHTPVPARTTPPRPTPPARSATPARSTPPVRTTPSARPATPARSTPPVARSTPARRAFHSARRAFLPPVARSTPPVARSTPPASSATPARSTPASRATPSARPATPAPASTPLAAATPALSKHANVNDIARFIAGLPPEHDAQLSELAKTPEWIAYAAYMDKEWPHFDYVKLDHIKLWSAKEFAKAHISTVFYPFSGPDFIHAATYFPQATSYILCGLEPVGDVPSIDKLQPLMNTTSWL